MTLHNNSVVKKQKGMTTISLVVLIAVFAFFVMLAFSVLPVYLENFKVKSHLKKLEEETGLAKMTDDDIIDTLFRRFQIDNVDSVSKQDVNIIRNAAGTDVTISYEVYAPFVANVEIVISFNENVSLPH